MEIKVDIREVDKCISDLSTLREEVELLKKNSLTMDESKGNTAEELLSQYGQVICAVNRLSSFVKETQDKVEQAKQDFIASDESLAGELLK